ncbi:hypothetical protein ADL22_12180 [Streptomyces sp. NRRL F-4489]|uniref:hypothetical protein n=1 Tax=Streptomyces sp. NRRL F-4489 TaxID=1609095 RepID=UPI0007492CFB|nr:hypothetical protein [Streptomyces sp. NRRL F-4489]KUL44696.1 hypothetical protein ADL22_12180 [Streptomyces sp. NRRL F-4489]
MFSQLILPGTKDVVDFEARDSGAPVGELLGAGEWLAGEWVGSDGITDAEAVGTWYLELDDLIINEVDEALEAQADADEKGSNGAERRHPCIHEIPVLRLPKLDAARKECQEA